MASPPAGEGPVRAPRETALRLLLRLGLVVAALALLWVAGQRALAAFFAGSDPLRWQAIVAGLAAGILLGLAVALPRPPLRYRIGRAAVVAALPAAVLTIYILAIPFGIGWVPEWLSKVLASLGPGSVIFAAFVVGVALAAGFTASGTSEPSGSRTPSSG